MISNLWQTYTAEKCFLRISMPDTSKSLDMTL